MPKIFISEEKLEYIKNQLKRKYIYEVADEIGMNPTTLKKKLDEIGFKVPKIKNNNKIRKTTLTEKELKFVKDNYPKIDLKTISQKIGIGYSRLLRNISELNLVITRKRINFDKNGYFDVDEFGKLYKN